MNRYSILFIGFLLISCYAFGQKNNVYNYYKYINKAELARGLSKDKRASKYYEKAFEFNRPFSSDILQYLWLYANRHYGNESKALQYAVYSAQRQMLSTKYFKKDSAFCQNISLIKDTTQSTIIPSLRDTLDSMRRIDMQVRLVDTISFERLKLTDSLNMQKIVKLFEAYGYINEDNAGDRAFNIITLIFVHCSKTQTEEPPFYILENAVRNGTFDARVYICLYDFCLQFRNEIFYDTIKRDSRFGTGMEQYKIVGDMLFIYPPEDVKKVNSNRELISMAETWRDYEKKLIRTFLNGGAGFAQTTPLFFSSKEEENEKKEVLKREIDSGKVKGKYIKGEGFSLQQ